MTLKVEDPPLVLTTLNEEWANKMQNISEMLNSKKAKNPRVLLHKAKEQKKNKGCTRRKTRGSAKVRGECENNKSST